MSETTSSNADTQSALDEVADAANDGRLSPGAAENIRKWLTSPYYAEYAPEVRRHIAESKWQALDDAFWTIIPFGTGGRRGRMYPIGSNAINDRTIGESAQGLADYVRRRQPEGGWSCAIAYDTRHRSRHFAELCAEVLVAAGFKVWFLDGVRSTPELSVAVRHKQCSGGIMVTASHNPPSDNAVKVYWSTGGQLLPPHDKGVIECVMNVKEIERKPFAEALEEGRVEYCQEEIDRVYLEGIAGQSLPGPRDLKILYSPMHGVGASSVCPALAAAGFQDVEVFGPHATPDGDFPNVPGHVANPENPKTFDALIEHAAKSGTELAMSTDPDADRLGAAAPETAGGPWKTFTGNQIGALLTDFVLQSREDQGMLAPNSYVVKTLVTTELVRRIADSYNATTYGNLLVGFKWIAEVIDRVGPDDFVLGTEESHGYQVGTYARDKDGGVAALLLAELAAALKSQGLTLHEKLDQLFLRHGCHAERTVSSMLPGAEGMTKMKALMASFREQPPRELAGMAVQRRRDYLNQVVVDSNGQRQPLEGPKGDLVIFDLAQDGNYVAVRPSGTEPKVKFYMFVREEAQADDLPAVKAALEERLDQLQQELAALAK